MKERPNCVICGKPALVFMYDTFYCGDCVIKFDKKNKERARELMREVLK